MARPTLRVLLLAAALAAATPSRAAAADVLCDPSFEDCRTRLINLIRAETAGIDVAFWFMEDGRYTAELIKKWRAGVPVRVIIDPQANRSYPLNADRLAELQSAGIPMRRQNSSGILHWKMMLFDAQNIVEFSAANYSPYAFAPIEPYVNYTDEVIYFADDPSFVNSFRTKYDSLWTDTAGYADYANITGPLTRRYDIFPKDPELNFPPLEPYRPRAVRQYDAETEAIDVIMFRITDSGHTDALLRAVNRGVPVRLYVEQQHYRDPQRIWHSYEVDRMYAGGVQVKDRAHAGRTHQKTVILKSQRLIIWGSSNWTAASNDNQEEHNHFTYKPHFYDFFVANFERKWNNLAGHPETKPFVPLPPNAPSYVSPANGATGVPLFAALQWMGGLWAHKYDIYFGTSPNPPLVQSDVWLGPSEDATQVKVFGIPSLQPSTTYYWRIVSKTMANLTATGAVRSFTTRSGPPAPPGDGNVVLYAARAPVVAGAWTVVPDTTAAGGARLSQPNANVAKLPAPLANPTHYFEMTFQAEAAVPYRLWMRGKAEANHWTNDSVYVQFSGSVTANGSPVWRIGSTAATSVNLEDGPGAGLSGWGWQDNGYGAGVLGEDVIFETAGLQTIRVQGREDGFSIDQIVLSPWTYRQSAPGALKNDTTILSEVGAGDPGGADPDGGDPGDPGSDPSGGDEVVLWAGLATTHAGRWAPASEGTAAGGMAMMNPDVASPKLAAAQAVPADYFELTFNAVAGKPYRLWIRGRAQNDYWGNDSVFVQFSGSVDQAGVPTWRIGTTSATNVNLEDGSGAGLAGWGWQDNGYGVGVLGPPIYFETTGPQRVRIQMREDGLSIDQIVLSSSQYLNAAPGALKQDTTILPQR